MNEQPAHAKQPNVPEQPDQAISNKHVSPFAAGLIVFGLIAVVLLVAKYVSDRVTPDVPGVVLSDIDTIEDLRSRFNQDQGAPRLILLLSPT